MNELDRIMLSRLEQAYLDPPEREGEGWPDDLDIDRRLEDQYVRGL